MSDNVLFYDQLNPRQLDAVHKINGPLLIIAGAGSGKTRVLTYRFANIIAQGEATPSQILCVTFTNKAAKEMMNRMTNLLQGLNIPVREQLWISTFHSTCVRILRENIHLLGYQPFFGIYDSSDQLSMVKRVLQILDINEKVNPAKSFQSRINNAKTEGLTPEDVGKSNSYYMDEQTIGVYKLYEQEMRKANSLDFSDLLIKTNELFDMYPAILEQYQDQFLYLMVDEYQDTNRIQYELIKKLGQKHKNICVVGDEDQSIYSWRGADISNILNFEKDFNGAETIKLEQNYRSTRNIVEAASYLIKKNTQRNEKTLFTDNIEGDKIQVQAGETEYDEARFVGTEIQKLISSGSVGPEDIAIFYRTNAQSRVLEEQLRTQSIAYKIVGGVKFYERREIKDIIAYLKLLLNPTDEVALKRIINVPARGIGKTTVEKMEDFAREKGVSLLEALPLAKDEKIVHAGACKKLIQFYNMMADLSQSFGQGKSASELYLGILDFTGYAQKLKEENTSESMARLDNLEEFNNAIVQFEQERGDEGSLQAFLEEMALVSDADSIEESEKCVTLMTLHVSKGLEYPVVFIVGMEEGLLPSIRSMESKDLDEVEEERRLAYVGITRAEKKVYLCYARNRRVWGAEQSHTPSRFIEEIPDKYLDRQQPLIPKFMSRYNSSKSADDDFAQYEPDYDNFSDTYYEDEAAGLKKGMKVRHPTFGIGNVYQVEGQGDNQKVSVVFSNNAVKKFVAKYARLEVI